MVIVRDKKKEILIVDDSILIAERLMDILKDIENIDSIKHAVNFSDAYIILQQTEINIAILDIKLPGENGIELLKMIKKNKPEITVIMFTNEASNYYKTLCRKLGADYFIDKSKEFELVPEIIQSLNNIRK